MDSRERVRRCLDFEHPDRVPRDTWLLPVAFQEHGQAAVDAFLERWPGDFHRPAITNEKLAALTEGDPCAVGRYRDEWGCVFENVHPGIIGQVKHPPIDNWSKLAEVRPPAAALDFDRDDVNRQCAATDRFVLAPCCPRPFERIQFLRGTENVLMDIARGRAELHQLLDIVHRFYCAELERWSRTDVDGLTFMDDWGSQNNLLISPRRWRELFKPLYAEYVRIAHAAGRKAFMHSDGHILAIYEDLIEIGVDAINSQLFCMDWQELVRRAKGRITFWGEVDRQHVLPAADPGAAREAVRQVVEHLYDPAGGVIAQFELGPGARLENADAIYRTWSELTRQAE
jgi:uroporphyrinogen decarboxylase